MLSRKSKSGQIDEAKVLRISPKSIYALAKPAAFRTEGEADDLVFRMSARQISWRIGQACEAAGLGAGYRGHSLRVGSALA